MERKTSRSVGSGRGVTSGGKASSNILTIRGEDPLYVTFRILVLKFPTSEPLTQRTDALPHGQHGVAQALVVMPTGAQLASRQAAEINLQRLVGLVGNFPPPVGITAVREACVGFR